MSREQRAKCASKKHLFIELPVDHVENLNVDGQHEEQGGQHPAQEVEVDHVVHADDRLKLAGHQQVLADQRAVVAEVLQVVPAHHGREAHDDGHQPAEEHGQASPPGRHHPLVAAATQESGSFGQTLFILLDVELVDAQICQLNHSNVHLDSEALLQTSFNEEELKKKKSIIPPLDRNYFSSLCNNSTT